jgi:hypothetical protein
MLTSAGHICAVQGTCSRLLAARTHNPPVVGSSPTRPLIESASQSLVTCEYGSGSRSWLAGACAVVLGKTPVYAGGCAECVPKTKINWDWRSQVAALGSGLEQCFADAAQSQLVLAGDALGVGPQQHLRAVPAQSATWVG